MARPAVPFAANIYFGKDCWLWMGSTTGGNGEYGQYWDVDKQDTVYAHRYAYEMAYGPIPDGMSVCHACDTPACVRRDHLFLGTHADNMRDMANKKRNAGTISHHGKKSECKHGHPFSAENTYARPDGGRGCKECIKRAKATYLKRKKTA